MQQPISLTPKVTRIYRGLKLGAPAFACSLLLGACATIDSAMTTASVTAARGAPFETISKDHARVLVPSEAGAALAVLQRRQYNNDGAVDVSQRIIIMGDSRTTGENAVDITFRSANNSDDFAPLTEAEMAEAMVIKVDNHPMSLSNRPAANGLGPFMLAIGQQDGENCVFAWQRTKSSPLGTHGGGRQTIIDMQIRLCRTERTLDQLIASLARFTVIEDGAADNIDTRQSAPAGNMISVAKPPNIPATSRVASHPTHQAKAKDPAHAGAVVEAELAR